MRKGIFESQYFRRTEVAQCKLKTQYRNVIIVSHVDIPQKVRFNRPHPHTHQLLFEIFSTGEDPKFEVKGGANIRQGVQVEDALRHPLVQYRALLMVQGAKSAPESGGSLEIL